MRTLVSVLGILLMVSGCSFRHETGPHMTSLDSNPPGLFSMTIEVTDTGQTIIEAEAADLETFVEYLGSFFGDLWLFSASGEAPADEEYFGSVDDSIMESPLLTKGGVVVRTTPVESG